jgi:hypothetical protein
VQRFAEARLESGAQIAQALERDSLRVLEGGDRDEDGAAVSVVVHRAHLAVSDGEPWVVRHRLLAPDHLVQHVRVELVPAAARAVCVRGDDDPVLHPRHRHEPHALAERTIRSSLAGVHHLVVGAVNQRTGFLTDLLPISARCPLRLPRRRGRAAAADL